MLAGLAGYDEDLAYLQGQLNTMKLALQRVQQYGEQPGQWTLEDIKTRYRALLGQLDSLRREVSGREMPSQFMLALSNFSDGVTKFGEQVAKTAATVVASAGSVASGLGTTAKFLPLVLIGALVVLGIGLSKGTLSASIRR